MEARHDQIDIPALNLSGWHDEGYGPVGAIRNYRGTKRNGSRLVIGPWRHGAPSLDRVREGELDFGVNAGLDHDALLLRWFDFHLKGERNGLEREEPVAIFVMGENAWREEDDWPLARRVETRYYLRSGDVEVTGTIEVDLFASSSTKDTDFVVRLLGLTLLQDVGLTTSATRRIREGSARSVLPHR